MRHFRVPSELAQLHDRKHYVRSRNAGQVEETARPDQYSDTHAPTTDFSIMRYLLSYAKANGLIVWNIEIKTAFLNAKLNEKILVKPPLCLV